MTSRSEVAGSSGIPDIAIERGLQAVSVCVGLSVAFDWGTCVLFIGDWMVWGDMLANIWNIWEMAWIAFVLGRRKTCIRR